MLIAIVSLLVQAFTAPQPAYACHRWIMSPDQVLTCEDGARYQHGAYRFERGSKGMVAIVEPGVR